MWPSCLTLVEGTTREGVAFEYEILTATNERAANRSAFE